MVGGLFLSEFGSVDQQIGRLWDVPIVSVSTACQRHATSQRHQGPAGEQLLARLGLDRVKAREPVCVPFARNDTAQTSLVKFCLR